MAIFSDIQRVAIYVHLRTFESDFDKSQSQMRAISSAWSAAVLAAIALITTTMVTAVVIPKDAQIVPFGVVASRNEILAYLRAVVCGAGSVGVLAFWYIDQAVYQRLLHSVFAYGLYIESEDQDLPQVRSSMYLANLDVTNQLGIFYRAQFLLFAVLSLVINILGWGRDPTKGGIWIVFLIHAFAVIFVEVRNFHKWPSLDRTIKDFYPKLAEKLPPRTARAGIYARVMDKAGTLFKVRNTDSATSRVGFTSDRTIQQLLLRIRHELPPVKSPDVPKPATAPQS